MNSNKRGGLLTSLIESFLTEAETKYKTETKAEAEVKNSEAPYVSQIMGAINLIM